MGGLRGVLQHEAMCPPKQGTRVGVQPYKGGGLWGARCGFGEGQAGFKVWRSWCEGGGTG